LTKEKKMRKMKIEKIGFSRENAAEKSFKVDTIFALIPCYETWHPWKK
jgi:hypothetical protein